MELSLSELVMLELLLEPGVEERKERVHWAEALPEDYESAGRKKIDLVDSAKKNLEAHTKLLSKIRDEKEQFFK